MRPIWIAFLVLGCGVEEPAAPDEPVEIPPPDCTAYAYNGETYDCTGLDRCDTEDRSPEAIAFWDACCDCDPTLCNRDPTCPWPFPSLPG